MVARVHKYADGGKVVKSEGGARQPPPVQPKKPPAKDTIQLDPKGSTSEMLKTQRARQMQELGLKDGGPVPNPKAPLGQGGRFAAVAAKAKAGGAKNPNAVAAAIGRKKYGAKKMGKMAAAGRKR
jgi:hypothetical protein